MRRKRKTGGRKRRSGKRRNGDLDYMLVKD